MTEHAPPFTSVSIKDGRRLANLFNLLTHQANKETAHSWNGLVEECWQFTMMIMYVAAEEGNIFQAEKDRAEKSKC